MSNTDTSARCAKCCGGGCKKGLPTRKSISTAASDSEGVQQRKGCVPIAAISGRKATAESTAIGGRDDSPLP